MNGKPLSIVIFSKDRAAQLDLCLKSIYKNLESLSQQTGGYRLYIPQAQKNLKKATKTEVDWNRQTHLYFHQESVYKGFKQALEYDMKEWEEYVLFFTDDDIVYRKFEHDFDFLSNAFEKNKELFCISLRLGTNTFVQDQYRNTMCLIPDSVIMKENTLRSWNWKDESMG